MLLFVHVSYMHVSDENTLVRSGVDPSCNPQATMAIVARKSTHRVIDAAVVLSLYPLSLIVVAGLEAMGWD